MKLSIITINYNNTNGLRRTIESVVIQSCRDYEYIVIEWPKWEDQLDLENPLKIEINKISASEREVLEK